jgi:hypothetical protein
MIDPKLFGRMPMTVDVPELREVELATSLVLPVAGELFSEASPTAVPLGMSISLFVN